jgi:hypothetical protein
MQEKALICEALDLTPRHFDRVLCRATKRIRKVLNKNRPLEALLHEELLEDINEYG